MLTKLIPAVKAASEAMEAGKELKDPAVWKDRQRTANLVLLVLVAMYAGVRIIYPELKIEMGMLEELAAIIAMILALIGNWFLVTATSRKIGKKPKG